MNYNSIKKTINRSRKDCPNYTGLKYKYNSLKDFAEHVEKNPETLIYREQDKEFSVSAYLCSSSKKNDHLILFDESLVNEFQNKNDMFVDATFRIVPDIKGVTQVLTIMCKKNNTVSNQ